MTNKQMPEAHSAPSEYMPTCVELEREVKRQHAEIQRLEQSESDLIGERDRLEEILDRIADAVLGTDRHEWSSHYDLEDAAQEIEDKMLEQHAEIERLRAEVMKANANLFEVRKLLDERPAMNQGLVVEYQKWTGKVYSLDFMNAQDAALQSTKEKP